MRISKWFCLVIIMTIVSWKAIAQDVEKMGIKAQIEAEANAYAEAWNRGDFDAVAATHHDSYTLVDAKGPSTLAQRLADLKDSWASVRDRGTLRFSNVTVRPLGEGYALAYGQANIVFSDGRAMLSIWFTSVYMKTPKGWLAIHDHG